jgi:ribokinase
MYDLVSIGDIKLDVFISLENCKHKCDLIKKNVCFVFGEKISVDVQDQQIAGSAPNVATALSRMNKKTAVISNMGADQTYDRAVESLRKERVATSFIKKHRGFKSAYSAVLNLQGEKTILVSYIHRQYHLPKNLNTHWLYLSEMGNDYEKLYNEIISKVRRDKTLLGFNPGNGQLRDLKPVLYKMIRETKTLFVNVEEARRIVKNSRLGAKSLCQRLFKLGPTEVIVTDGRNGSYGFDGTNFLYCPIFPAERVEATGAGDAFASGYIGARMHGHGMATGLMWGSVNAAEVVQHIGPVTGLLSHRLIVKRLKEQRNLGVEHR